MAERENEFRRCYWVRLEDGMDCFIPNCWGGVSGPDACTCEVEGSRLDRLQCALDAASSEVERLRAKLARQHDWHEGNYHRAMRLHREVVALRAAQEVRHA